MFKGKLRALRYLMRHARGIDGKLKLAAALVGGELSRPAPGAPRHRRVPFREFNLNFRVGQNELTPYIDLSREAPAIVRAMGTPVRELNVLDVGANIGIFALFFREAKKIVSVEPNPACCECIARNFADNAVRGTFVQKAVYKESGRLRMDFSGGSVLAKIADTGGTEVDATTIDALVEEHFPGEAVDLLKIDIEGRELDALAGAQRSLASRRIRHVYLEFWSDDALRKLDETLSAHGYGRTMTEHSNALYSSA